MRRPRVLALSADLAPAPWSGIGVAVARQAEAMASLGADVHVLVPDDRPRPRAPRGVTVHALGRSSFPVDPRGFDGVHLHSLRLADLALELKRRFRLPLTTTVHGWPHRELADRARGAAWSRVLRRTAAASDRVVFLSRAERALGLAEAPELAGRSRVIAHGVPAPDAGAGRRSGGPVVFAGRFARGKGVHLLSAIVPSVLARRGVRFVLAGGHGDAEGEAAVARLAARFPGACTAPGWLDRGALDALFAEAALVIAPSVYEPFGLAALEAMRMGAPVLAADVGGLRDVVTPGSGGRRVRGGAPEWSEAIVDLLDDDDARARLSERGPDHARRFCPVRSAERLLQEGP